MKYPEWAPSILVARHKSQLDKKSSEGEFKRRTLGGATPREVFSYKNMTEAHIENYQRYTYRISWGYFNEESIALLYKLITDIRMEVAWKAISKRIDNDLDFYFFFFVCEDSIEGWRNDLKHTAAEQELFYQEIQDTAGKLRNLMNKSGKFDFYSIDHLVDDQGIEWLKNALGTTRDLSYIRAAVFGIMPEIDRVLLDISAKAFRYGGEELFVKKPNSENANIHYFVRSLSQYFKDKYKQPLHEVVARTTEVVFERQNIDSDYIRKLVG